MRHTKQRTRKCFAHDDGNHNLAFTLVEMLISVALVMLMMVLFAQVFQFASGSISQMRSIAENDQRARTLQTVIKADLDKRTFRWVFPFAAHEDVGLTCSNIGKRQGYFYISENNANNTLDDVLQFTAMSTLTMRNTDTTPYFGQALALGPSLKAYPNQPDFDDGQVTANSTGSSTAVELSYFVRNGNLYRRQLMIREPSPLAGTDPQPRDGLFLESSGEKIFDPTSAATFHYPNSANYSFWNDFDYSATYSSSGTVNTGAVFIGTGYLDNSRPENSTIAAPYARFGHYPLSSGNYSNAFNTNPLLGLPKEFATNDITNGGFNFLGRFTLLECSDLNFRYPQDKTTSGHIPTDPSLPLSLEPTDLYVEGPGDDFGQGVRRGEDLLLSNVQSFDIQVWDDLSGSFVNIGDPLLRTANSNFARNRRLNPNYGPRPSSVDVGYASYDDGGSFNPSETGYAVNAVFDTWHPRLNLNIANDPPTSPDPDLNQSTGQTKSDAPPYYPVILSPTDPTVPLGTVGYNGYWLPDQKYVVGSIVFPTGPAGLDRAAFSGIKRKLPYGYPFFYRCVQSTGIQQSAIVPPGVLPGANDELAEPNWPLIDGVTVNDGYLVWQAVDNRLPLRAIRLQIRFLDVSSQQIRQITIVHSLVD